MSSHSKESESRDDFLHQLIQTRHPYGVYLLSRPITDDESNSVRDALGYVSLVSSALAPHFVREETSVPVERYNIQYNFIRIGRIIAEPHFYEGDIAYEITLPGYESYVLHPGDPMLVLHVLHSFEKNNSIDVFQKIREIRTDFEEFCTILKNPEHFQCSEKQFELPILQYFQNAPLFGISHLVRLVSRNGIPSWDIADFPNFRKAIHTLDSQFATWFSGGKRRVKAEDIRVFFLPPKLRNQLLCNIHPDERVSVD